MALSPDQQRLQAELQRSLHNNRADLYLQSAADLTALWKALCLQQGFNEREVAEIFHDVTGYVLENAPGYASAAVDAVILARLGADMARSGSILNTYRVVARGGQQYIVFQGRPGLRRLFTAPAYKATNPKVLAMGIGKQALKAGARSGLLITLIVSPICRTVDWLLNDKGTIHTVLATVATDVVKGAIATAAGLMAGIALVGGAAATVAVAPVALGVIMAIAVGFALDQLDARFGLTDGLAKALADCHEQWVRSTETARRDANYFFGSTRGQLDFIRRFSGASW